MTPSDAAAAALAHARALGLPPPGSAPVEALRAEALEWLSTVPEPPLYPRTDDPARTHAAALLPAGIALLGRAWALDRAGQPADPDGTLARALQAHVEALAAATEGQIGPAEQAWARGTALAREARTRARAWRRDDAAERPVWDAATGTSRYDPRPAPALRVRLACAHPGCRAEAERTLPPAVALHVLTCGTCRRPFTAYLAEARELKTTRTNLGLRHAFRLEALGGGASRVEFEDSSREAFHAARGDLLAFVYTDGPVLRGVSNLASGRTLWVRRAAACYLATAVYGPDAPELEVLRAYRDEVLLRSGMGRGVVACYYRVSPALVRRLGPHPRLRALVRSALDGWVGRMARRRRAT